MVRTQALNFTNFCVTWLILPPPPKKMILLLTLRNLFRLNHKDAFLLREQKIGGAEPDRNRDGCSFLNPEKKLGFLQASDYKILWEAAKKNCKV